MSNEPTVPSTTQPSEFRFKPLSKPGSSESKVQTIQSRQNRVQVLSPANPKKHLVSVWCDHIVHSYEKLIGRDMTQQEMNDNHEMFAIHGFLESIFRPFDPNIKVSEIHHVSKTKDGNAYLIVFDVDGGWDRTKSVRDRCPQSERENKGLPSTWWQVGNNWKSNPNFLLSQNKNPYLPITDLYKPGLQAKKDADTKAFLAAKRAFSVLVTAEQADQVCLAAAVTKTEKARLALSWEEQEEASQ